MARMVRKQIYIEPRQEALLKRRARELGVSEAELIRRAIEQAGLAAVPQLPDRQAWEEELAFLRQRARLQELGRQRSWTREELYEERLQRFSR
ncbi:MAG: hypothetical protein QN131_14130 [Armatimonadota bacterium]|nr:hypothetical protein [Armatimonadota bacterium]